MTVVTPLMAASENSHVKCIDVLIKSGADVNTKKINGETALMFVAQCDVHEYIGTLIKQELMLMWYVGLTLPVLSHKLLLLYVHHSGS